VKSEIEEDSVEDLTRWEEDKKEEAEELGPIFEATEKAASTHLSPHLKDDQPGGGEPQSSRSGSGELDRLEGQDFGRIDNGHQVGCEKRSAKDSPRGGQPVDNGPGSAGQVGENPQDREIHVCWGLPLETGICTKICLESKRPSGGSTESEALTTSETEEESVKGENIEEGFEWDPSYDNQPEEANFRHLIKEPPDRSRREEEVRATSESDTATDEPVPLNIEAVEEEEETLHEDRRLGARGIPIRERKSDLSLLKEDRSWSKSALVSWGRQTRQIFFDETLAIPTITQRIKEIWVSRGRFTGSWLMGSMSR
jgi:hypothetical protein